jgi:hypothetical protein
MIICHKLLKLVVPLLELPKDHAHVFSPPIVKSCLTYAQSTADHGDLSITISLFERIDNLLWCRSVVFNL